MVGFTILGSISKTLLIGVTPQAVTVMLLVTTFLSIFQHTYIKTPQWLGYFIKRSESHTVHHAKGIHKHNYSDLTIFDIVFGTLDNPQEHVHETGFYNRALNRIGAMLMFKDVSTYETQQVLDK